jgi:diguanylate cyclase (GGDEF)-like protein
MIAQAGGLPDRRSAKVDELTGLPGRDALLGRIATLPETAECGLLCIDIDQLAALNEAMGLTAGDQLIAEVARRIGVGASHADLLVRLDGDEFALLLDVTGDAASLESITAAMEHALSAPYVLAGREVFVSSSIGSAYGNKQLLRHAQTALAHAKESTRGGWLMYSEDMSSSFGEYFHLETELRHAIDGDQFLVFYQPKASCRSGAITGFEALLRWNHPDRGIVPPSEFIPRLEKSGLIQRVGAWVLRTACAQLKAWHQAGYVDLHMAINLSLRQLADPDFPDQVRDIMDELKVPLDHIELEITESMLMSDVSKAERSLRRLKYLGLHLSIDDFGTGYSSLSYLKRLPIDILKVDRSFVQDITFDPNDASITRAIISLAHSLKMAVVAEGVETEAQIATLVAEQCETIQGYYISKPLPAAEANAFLASGWTIPPQLLGRPVKQRTLLLVDDEESILLALKRLLRREDYRILCGKSGAEGLELLAKNDIDVVVSDQRMPEMTGEEFLRRTKELYPRTVRIVLSGFADMDAITNAINQGAIYKFMSKPWDEKTLKVGIQEAFLRKERNDRRQNTLTEIAQANAHLQESNQTLSVKLDEQAQTAVISQAALNIFQETLNKLPLPVLGFDTAGLVVLRNEACILLSISEEVCSELAGQFPSHLYSDSFELEYKDAGGKHWKIVARHLMSGQGHRGTVLAFISNEK